MSQNQIVDNLRTIEFQPRVGIQWRADDILFDFETYPNYQKLSKFSTKSTTAAQNLSA